MTANVKYTLTNQYAIYGWECSGKQELQKGYMLLDPPKIMTGAKTEAYKGPHTIPETVI